jgi:maltose phosphorylase
MNTYDIIFLGHIFKTSEKYFTVDPWRVIEEGFDPQRQRLAESIFSLANEFMCVRGYFEEGYSGDHLLGSYFSQLYDLMDIKHPQVFKGFITEGATMINTVDWLYTRISLDDEELDLGKVKFSDFRRTLDLKNATLKREFVWTTATHKQLRITFLRFANIVNTAQGWQRVILEPLNFSGEVKIRSGLDFDTLYELAAGWDQTQGTGSGTAKKDNLNFWTCERKQKVGDVRAIQARTRRSGIRLFSGFRLMTDPSVKLFQVEREKFIGVEFSLQLMENQVTSFDKIVVNHWEQTNDIEQVWNNGLNLAGRYAAATYDQALREHNRCWANFWRRMDIEIQGDPELQQGVRYSLFAMYINYHGESDRRNVICKLGGEVYNGVNFWDTEIYCHRMYMFLNPEIARKLLMYRYHYLSKAIENAQRVDLEGARYPFATITGVEEMGTWQHVELEIHQNEAYRFLAYAARLDLDNYNRNTEQGIHSSAAAGVWAGIVSGFGGLRTDAATLILNPVLPRQWQSFRFKMTYAGSLLEVSVTKEEAFFKVLEGDAVTLNVYGEPVRITAEGVAIRQKRDMIPSGTPEPCLPQPARMDV